MEIVQPNDSHEIRARRIWTLFIMAFFGIQALIWVAAITLTASDPSFAVAPHYEQESENWDAVIASRRSSTDLGWSIEFSRQDLDASPSSELRIRLADRAGQPIDNAQIDLILFHCARAAESQLPKVRGLADGLYAAEAKIDRNGWWKLNGVVRRGVEVFHFDCRQLFEASGVSQ